MTPGSSLRLFSQMRVSGPARLDDLLGIRPEGGVQFVEADPQCGAAVGLERGLLASGVQLQESLGTVHPEEVVDERGTLVIGRRPRIPVPIQGDQLSEGQAPPPSRSSQAV